ncbi:inositol 1,4,5-triphosphate receptor associated 2-like isoform X2 [Periplaneta americana]|uniref:inositol 1,4,5-triphosphate receptor associated 2-like isoform X2 n=1 Tax=Periplaneta americana TaxID=6978 RepID=UPI0037E97E11
MQCPGTESDVTLTPSPILSSALPADFVKGASSMITSTPEDSDAISTQSSALNRTTAAADFEKGAPSITSTPEEQESATSMRRCYSESQVQGVEGSCSSVSSEASSSSGLAPGTPEVFPSLPDVVLQELGLTTAPAPASTPSDVLSEQDIENKFSSLSLAFKTDKLTLTSRHDRQQRQRDLAERNMAAEVLKLKTTIHNLNYLCKDSESIDILGKIQNQVDVLQRSTERVSSSAEIYGAVQQETRLSKAIEVMLTHVENLKRMYEKEHAELEETKRVLLENNLVVEGNGDNLDGGQRNARHRILNSGAPGKQRRRASIAVFRPLGSPDSSKNSPTSLTFGESKNHVRPIGHSRRTSSIHLESTVNSRRTSSTHLEGTVTGRDRTDRLDGPDVVGGSMDDIKELVEVRREDEQGSMLEENNNSTGTANLLKSSRFDSEPEVGSEIIDSSYGDMDKNSSWPSDSMEDNTKVPDSTSHPFLGNMETFRSFRDSASDFIYQTRTALMDNVVPLNVDHMLIQTRRCATFLLLCAALWSLLSTFVPIAAQSTRCVPFSWVTWEELLHPYVTIRRNGPPPI